MAENEPAGGEGRDLLRRAARGAGIGVAVAGLSRLIFFAQQLILARLLAADSFGQYAFATLVVGLPALLVNLRGAEAIVQREGGIAEPADDAGLRNLIDTSFTAQLALALVMAAVLAAAGGPIGRVAGKPYLGPLVAGLSVLVLSAVGGVSSNSGPLLLPVAVLERRLDFLRARLPELLNVIVNLLVSVSLALAGLGAWSLVGGALAGSAAQVLLVWRLARYAPRLRIDAAAWRRLLDFGWPLYVSALLSWGYLNADYYFVGSFLGEAPLGLYYMAFNISQVPLQVRFVLSRVAFPAFSRARVDEELLTRLYAGATRYAAALAGCVCAAGIGLATPAVRILLGEAWLPAAPTLQILLLSTLIRTGLGFNGDLLTSLGKTGTVLISTALALGVLLVLGPLFMLRAGIQGMAVAVCLSSLSSATLSSIVIGRRLPIRYGRELLPALICLTLTAGLGLTLAAAIHDLWGLAGAALTLLLVYGAIYLGAFDRRLARQAWGRLRQVTKGA